MRVPPFAAGAAVYIASLALGGWLAAMFIAMGAP